MTLYELMFIIKPELELEKQTAFIEKVKALILEKGAKITHFELIGKKSLATHFNKQTHGIFVLLNFETGVEQVNAALTGLFQVSEELIRHIIVRLDPLPKQKLKKSKAAKKAAVEASAEPVNVEVKG